MAKTQTQVPLMASNRLSALLESEQKVIDKITLGASLEECLNSICLQIEYLLDSPDVVSSILLLEGNRIKTIAGPHLPPAFCKAINGLEIGPHAGSCGTAMFYRKQVIVSDIANDPLWANYKDIALPYGLRACWSTPIISSENKVLGSFAIYYKKVMNPTQQHLDLIDSLTHLSRLAIERSQSIQREKQLLSELTASNEKFRALVSVIPDLTLVLDSEGNYVDIFCADKNLIYATEKNRLGSNVKDILPPETADLVMDVIKRTIATKKVQIIEYELPVPKGTIVFEGRTAYIEHYLPDHPETKHVLWIARDITERKLAEKKVEQLAFYDPLTTLPNRRLLLDRLQRVIEKISRDQKIGALLYLDLDDFKRINDSLGHEIGDQLLCLVATRLNPILRATDTFARIGGDEFVVLLENRHENMVAEAKAVAQKILTSLQAPFKLENAEYKIGASIGICLLENGHISAGEALKRADAAMYKAKKLGSEKPAFFDPQLQKIIDERILIERDLLDAIQAKQFTAYFQPQLSPDGTLLGAEALIRWQHQTHGLISPIHFIPIAERCGLIYSLQDIVLNCVCDVLEKLQLIQLPPDFTISLNVSTAQLESRKLAQSLMPILKKRDIAPDRLKLEITESTLLQNHNNAAEQMHALAARGFKFSIDNFGSGFSSIAYLNSFPIHELKIDRCFVNGLPNNQNGAAIIDAIIALSDHLHFGVLAEGVETQEQAELLCQRPIKGMQGYLYAHPMDSSKFVKWVSHRAA